MADVNLDQETTIDTCQGEESCINLDDPCAIHLDDISPVVKTQSSTGIKDNVNSTLDDASVNIIGNSKVTFAVGSSGNNLSHQKNIPQNENTVDTSISKEVFKSKKVRQYRSTSITLTKSHAVCCKLSVAFVICCTTRFSLMPIVFYYVSQIGNDVPTDPEYSHERNISTAKVCYSMTYEAVYFNSYNSQVY